MTGKNLVIDREKCIHCGLCVKDCIAYSLEFDENKFPQFADGGEERCIKCQHCLAICPVGAVSILDKNPENSDKVLHNYNSDELLNLIKGRRSFRHFKKENLDPQILTKLKDMLNWVPTGCNNHKLHFSFIEDINVMDDFRKYTNEKLINILKKSPFKGMAGKFSRYQDALLNGEDVVFRGAPHMVVVSTPLSAPCVNVDPIIALSYFELYAQSVGVATLWCGFAEACFQIFPELCDELKIPDGYKASYVMMFGPADVKYTRTTQPESFEFTVMEKFAPKKMSFIDKLKRYFWNFSR